MIQEAVASDSVILGHIILRGVLDHLDARLGQNIGNTSQNGIVQYNYKNCEQLKKSFVVV